MATITLRNVDDAVVEQLRKRAEANARSLEVEAEEVLAHAVLPLRKPGSKWETVRHIAEMTPDDVVQTDSVLLLREDRER